MNEATLVKGFVAVVLIAAGTVLGKEAIKEAGKAALKS